MSLTREKSNSLGWILLCIAALLAMLGCVSGHTYHLGSCPTVEPMPEFDMSKFLGKWYVVQKTSTGSRCVFYNFTSTGEPGSYKVEQISEHPVLGLASVDNNYHYTGNLKAVPDVPAKMTVRFPLSVAGSASYVVFSTDYSKYAGIFTCQKLAFAHRLSATILSRSKTLEKMYLDKVRSKLSASGVSPFDLSNIDQSNCPASDAYNINIDDETFSPHNIGGAVKKAGEKLGEGVEAGLNGAKKVYNTLSSGEDKDSSSRKDGKKEDINDPGNRYHYDTEWLP